MIAFCVDGGEVKAVVKILKRLPAMNPFVFLKNEIALMIFTTSNILYISFRIFVINSGVLLWIELLTRIWARNRYGPGDSSGP